MFTGIIQSLGTVTALSERGGDLQLTVSAPQIESVRLGLGASVAVAGVCLTVAQCLPHGFVADVSRETLGLTTLARLQVGQRVNLEPALVVGDALGGHWVSGHVDGVSLLLARSLEARSQRLRWRVPGALAQFVAPKGSVALDGVSLTINEVEGEEFGVNLIPHTLQVTTLGELAVGDAVNLEVDVLARYAVRALKG